MRPHLCAGPARGARARVPRWSTKPKGLVSNSTHPTLEGVGAAATCKQVAPAARRAAGDRPGSPTTTAVDDCALWLPTAHALAAHAAVHANQRRGAVVRAEPEPACIAPCRALLPSQWQPDEAAECGGAPCHRVLQDSGAARAAAAPSPPPRPAPALSSSSSSAAAPAPAAADRTPAICLCRTHGAAAPCAGQAGFPAAAAAAAAASAAAAAAAGTLAAAADDVSGAALAHSTVSDRGERQRLDANVALACCPRSDRPQCVASAVAITPWHRAAAHTAGSARCREHDDDSIRHPRASLRGASACAISEPLDDCISPLPGQYDHLPRCLLPA